MRQYSRVITWIRVAALVSFVALGLAVYVRYTQAVGQIGTLTGAQRLAAATTQLLLLTGDLDASARGFVITGREEMLSRDASVRNEIPDQIDRLRQAVPSNDDDQQRRSQSFIAGVNRIVALTDQIVTTRRQSGEEAAKELMVSQGELTAITDLRGEGDALAAAARQNVADERAATQRSRAITGYLIETSLLSAIAMLVYAGFQMRRELRRRGQAEEQLRLTHAEVEREVASRTHELLNANARVESRERRLQLVADFGLVHLMTTTDDGSCQYMSRGFEDMTGLGPTEVLNRGWLNAVHTDDCAALLSKWPAALATRSPFEADFRIRLASGEDRGFKLRAMPVLDEQSRVTEWFCAMIDLHDQQAVEAMHVELLRAEQTLRANAETANRIKDDLLATVSHELRTPLNAIVGWAQILKIDSGENRARAVEAIERNAFVQTRLIDDLLDVSRMSKGQFTLRVSPIDLRASVEAALLTIGPAAAAKGVTIDVKAPDDVRIRGDESRLQQVAWNLLSNAVKFTPKGGTVTVEVSQLGNRARLRVTDTGEGIDPTFLSHVFEPFRQGESRQTRLGLGLGLAIVRQIVELHGGTVLATSDGPHRGASFTIVLPMSPAGAVVQQPLATAPLRPLNLRILVVEDDEDAAVTLSALLQHRGCDVQVAHTVKECLQLFGSARPDLLLCDIGLPDGDGYTLLRQLRSHSPDRPIPAIALSAFAREEDRAHAADVGFAVYLTKPYEAEQLFDHIRRVTKAS